MENVVSGRARTPRRMNPEDRESAILDCAATIVAREGVSAATMDRISQESNVSRSLIYVYFKNVTELLQRLYLRETLALRKRQRHESAQLEDFEDYVRCLVRLYLENVHEKGDFMSKLMHEPTITGEFQSDFFVARRAASLTIAERISKEHAIPVSLAARLADMLMGLTARAGEQVLRFGLPYADAPNLVATMLMGAIEATANKYHRGKIVWPSEPEVLGES